MSNSSGETWSDNPYAPEISYPLYLTEKAYFTGLVVGAILYGIVIVLFIRYIGAFLDPANRARGGVRWGLAIHAITMFSFATIYIGITANIQSISFIDNREFPASVNGIPGPVGYQFFISPTSIAMVPFPTILFNKWLGDGLLLYRCYIIYSRRPWAITVPTVLYLASFGTGIMLIYKGSRWDPVNPNITLMMEFGIPFFMVSFSLNILLTFMIVTRLVLHRRQMQRFLGEAAGIVGVYKATTTLIIESYAICACMVVLYLGTWGSRNFLQHFFLQILAQVQVIAPFLIALRIADRRAITSDAFGSKDSTVMHFNSQDKSAGGDGTVPGGHLRASIDVIELGPEGGTVIELGRDSDSVYKESLEA